MITLRHAMTCLLGIGSLLVAANSCAASPWPSSSPAGGALRDRAGAYDVEVLVDGVSAATFGHDGETYVLGQLGARYTLRVHNRSGRRIEAVVSVDGRDVIDGKPAEVRSKRGYLVPAYGQIDIDGWRVSQSEAAAFRFSSVRDSYAARTGSAREVGVIGVAVFPERYVPPPPRPRPLVRPYSYSDPYPYPYGGARRGYDDDELDGLRSRDRSASNEPPTGAAPAAPPATTQPAPRSAAGDSANADAASESARGYGGPGAEKKASRAERSRPGLGTDYGESVSSPTYEVEFVRANPGRPSVVMGMRYNDRDGLLALGIDVDGTDRAWSRDEDLRRTANPFPASDRRYAAPPPGWRRSCCMQ